MDTRKRNNGVISFTDKSQKEEVQRILRDTRLQNLMPENVRNKDGLMVLWAVRFLKNLADKGKMRYEVPMFEDDSAEKQGLLAELEQLRQENKTLKEKLRSNDNGEKATVDGECQEPEEYDYEPDLMAVTMMQPMKRESRIKRTILRQ